MEPRDVRGAFEKAYYHSYNYAKHSCGAWSMYRVARRYYAKVFAAHVGAGRRVLEVGCSFGHLLSYLEDEYEAVGIDVSVHATTIARSEVARRSRILTGSAEEPLPFESGFFDGIISLHVLEHLRDPEFTLRECSRVLRPGGALMFAVPNMKFMLRHLKGKPWSGEWSALKDKTHISLLAPEEWRRLLADNRFQLVKVFGDGAWDSPYLPLVPAVIQKVVFGLPSAVQVLAGATFIRPSWGENNVYIARRRGDG